MHAANANILNSIEYRDTGVILQVRPRINSNQAVSLEIAQEVSRVDNPGTPANPNLNPTFTKRKITSRVNVQSGQTVVLGGLIQDQENRSRDRVPLLGEIPVVGNLFGTTSNVNDRTELIVFLTPRVIRNPEDARDVSEELRSRLRSLRQADDMPLGVPEPYVPPPGQQPAPAYPQPLVVPRERPAAGPLRPVAGTRRLGTRPGLDPTGARWARCSASAWAASWARSYCGSRPAGAGCCSVAPAAPPAARA